MTISPGRDGSAQGFVDIIRDSLSSLLTATTMTKTVAVGNKRFRCSGLLGNIVRGVIAI